ncbi:MAG: CPBP family intramembrane metalloprotease [Chlamydiia bacterium]|nr:CPBP family intramembrane metalloprotease [Chlamydiia bacterium]
MTTTIDAAAAATPPAYPELEPKENSASPSHAWSLIRGAASQVALSIIGMATIYNCIEPSASLAAKVTPNALDCIMGPIAHIPATLSQIALGFSYVAADVLTGTAGEVGAACSSTEWKQVAVGGPLAEEFVFRFLLQDKMIKPAVDWTLRTICPNASQKFRERASAITAIFAASALFASAHHVAGSTGESQLWMGRFLRGLIYGSLEELGGILPATLAHTMNNHCQLARKCQY